jgi:hypothetical protein
MFYKKDIETNKFLKDRINLSLDERKAILKNDNIIDRFEAKIKLNDNNVKDLVKQLFKYSVIGGSIYIIFKQFH